MSQKNNVNPDHYKIGGRDRPNEVVPPGSKEQFTEDRARFEKRKGRK